ncbi:hypothetical protein ACWGJP_10405 [Microbacterium sp. NPDC055903]
MKGRDLRMLPVAGGAWAAALVCVSLPKAVGGVLGVAGACAVVALLFAVRRGKAATRAALLVVVAAVGAGVAVSASLAGPVRAELAAVDGRYIVLEARVSSSSSIGADGRLWFAAQTLTVSRAGETVELDAPVRIGVEPTAGADLGALIRVSGQAMATDAGEGAVLVVFANEAEIVSPAEGVFAVAAQTRSDFAARATMLPEPGAGLLPGLAVGDTRAVSPELNDAMLTSGLSHLTAVSGETVDLRGG